ncbi:molybdopterin-synthase adenylyltransferase MoeB [Segeticoccus rhizosphaerae]|uniref:molybdopterin-synthase adenylyltransferase MoeB n=1 Tax=Segeticoccus rhizosphaerae TaxID=1104777 RepID=UPI0010BF6EC3|nr:molybdopterin-synthase adenylyltransferase MoeB [Ornithinicoccus soli]
MAPVLGPAALIDAGVPTASPSLTPAETSRYARHILIPEVGLEGQRRLRSARVLVVGAGGLGSPALLYLAAAGVGTLGIVDDDVVDVTNLQRQVVHGVDDVGAAKTSSAARTVAAINPGVEVVEHRLRIDSDNALDLVSGYDLVVDGTDNFPTRYLLNDACVLTGKPHVWASIYRFDGQVSVWWAQHGPCYRCVFPEPPAPGLVPSCAEGGVLGVLPAAMGSVQSTEAIKLLLGIGEPLVGRLLVHDALRQTWDTLTVRKDPGCPVCGEHPTITELVDYRDFCGMPSVTDAGSGTDVVPTVSVRELRDLLRAREAGDGEPWTLVDVRGPEERSIVSIPGADVVLMDEFRSGAALSKIPADRPVIVHCKSGARSAEAVRLLRASGRTDARNLEGGVLAWVAEVDPSLPTY